MNVTGTTGTTGNTTTSGSAVASSGALTTDFETFLKLMTTQLQYQDPLNPVDSTEYLSQLASFSAVEQQTRTNKLLESMKSSFDLFGMSQAASWVGHEARAAVPALVEAGQSVSVTPRFAAQSDRAVLVIKDAQGELVNRIDLSVTATEYEWQPLDMKGAALPDGLYTLSIENYKDGVQAATTEPEVYGKITEVQGLNGDTVLMLNGGRQVSAGNVTAIRN